MQWVSLAKGIPCNVYPRSTVFTELLGSLEIHFKVLVYMYVFDDVAFKEVKNMLLNNALLVGL